MSQGSLDNEEFICYLQLKDRDTNSPIMRIPLTYEGVYDILNKVYKSLTPVVVSVTDPEACQTKYSPVKFFYNVFLICNIFDYLKENAPHVFKYDFVKDCLKTVRTYKNLLMKYVKYEYVDFQIAKHPNNCSIIQNAYSDAEKIKFEMLPTIVSKNVDATLLGVAVLQKKDYIVSDDSINPKDIEKREEESNEVENIYEDELVEEETKDRVLDQLITEALKKDNLDYNNYKFMQVYYLHPKFLQFFENLANSIDVLCDFDYCLNLTTIFIFYSSLLESRFELSKKEKDQTYRILSKLKTKLHSNNRADFDDGNLISMMSETYEFAIIEMPSIYNNAEIFAQTVVDYYIGERDNEFIDSIDSLLFRKDSERKTSKEKDSEEAFTALTTVEYLKKKIEADELKDYSKSLEHIVKEKGAVSFYRDLRAVYRRIASDPSYEFYFGREDGRDEYD